MKSLTSPDFWAAYQALPPEARRAARQAYRLWRENPHHGSLRFQKRGRYWRAAIDEKLTIDDVIRAFKSP